ncbi:hypothetical protein B296_00000090 [Ensete ventricosum]|uniref:Uncharacterized protein n=1 Tax=Ensete ventricosum TaxID=4639 RepID=A0A427B2S1_ENSVE|nr:hypothetical protein B296_00000090 [Ensete ventricosum]
MVKHYGESSKMVQAGPLPKQTQVGCKCKLARKLLEPLMRSATVNMTSVKLGTLRERRRHNLVHQLGKGDTRRDFQRWKPASMFLKRAWRNSIKAKEASLG